MICYSKTITTAFLTVCCWLNVVNQHLLMMVHAQDNTVVVADYGVDCTFPIHSKEFKCDYNFADDRQKFYKDFMQGCRDYYNNHNGNMKASRCDATEDDRISMSLRQPQSMVNYTSTGFQKIRAPKQTMDMLLTHWERNRAKKKQEVWGTGSIYV